MAQRTAAGRVETERAELVEPPLGAEGAASHAIGVCMSLFWVRTWPLPDGGFAWTTKPLAERPGVACGVAAERHLAVVESQKALREYDAANLREAS